VISASLDRSKTRRQFDECEHSSIKAMRFAGFVALSMLAVTQVWRRTLPLTRDEPATVTVKKALRPGPEMHVRADEHDVGECAAWLREALAGGRVPAAELRRASREAGFAWSTLDRVRSRIGASTDREGFGARSKNDWYLRDATPHGSDASVVPTQATIDLTSEPYFS
jgi:hypothetical protein